MMRQTLTFTLLFCFLFSFRTYGQLDGDTLFYEIQPEMIADTRIHQTDGEATEYLIHVRIKKDYYSGFEKLTSDNLGNFLAIVYEGEVISPSLPTIQTSIPRGRFYIGAFKKEEKAKKVMQQILGKDG